MSNERGTPPPRRQSQSNEPVTLQTPGRPAGPRQIRILGWGFILFAALLMYLFLRLWPSGLKAGTASDTARTIYLLGAFRPITITLDQQLILMVLVAGGLGSFIHAATSFGDFVGNEKLTINWTWWYVLRLPIGMVLAAVFYLVIRGGFLAAGTEAGNINPFGIAALGGLVGMFSKQATDKLSEVFDTLFKTAPGAGDSKRKDDLHNPVPVVTDIEPKSKEPLTDNLVITVKGTGFTKGSVVRVKGESRETEFKDPGVLSTKLLPDDVAAEGELELAVFNPGPGGGTSTPIKLKIAAAVGGAAGGAVPPAPGAGTAGQTPPAPPPTGATAGGAQPASAGGVTVSDVSPDSGPAKGGTSVAISGTNFAAPAAVTFGDTPAITATVLSATAIIVQSPPHDAGAVDLVVEAGGGKVTFPAGFRYTADA